MVRTDDFGLSQGSTSIKNSSKSIYYHLQNSSDMMSHFPNFLQRAASPPPSGPGPRLWSLLSPLSNSCPSVWGHSNPARASAFHSSLQAMAWDRESTNVVPWCAALYSYIWNIKFPYCIATLGILSPYYCCISSYTLFLPLMELSVLVCDLTVHF